MYVRYPWAQFQLSWGKCQGQDQDIPGKMGWTLAQGHAPWISFTCSHIACETHPIWKSQSASPPPLPSLSLSIFSDISSLQYVARYNQNSFRAYSREFSKFALSNGGLQKQFRWFYCIRMRRCELNRIWRQFESQLKSWLRGYIYLPNRLGSEYRANV